MATYLNRRILLNCIGSDKGSMPITVGIELCLGQKLTEAFLKLSKEDNDRLKPGQHIVLLPPF